VFTAARGRACLVGIALAIPSHAIEYCPHFNNETFQVVHIPAGTGVEAIRALLDQPPVYPVESLLLYTYFYHHANHRLWDPATPGAVPSFDIVLRSFPPSSVFTCPRDVRQTPPTPEVWVLPNQDCTEWTVVTHGLTSSSPCGVAN
jgi:hypothetical protein